MPPIKKMIGKKFGRLLVLKSLPKVKGKCFSYLCKCDCGKERNVDGSKLRSGHTKSCGCSRIKWTPAERRTLERYNGAKSRCKGNNKDYSDVKFLYNSFEEMVEDIGLCPEGMEIDRADPYGNYEPGNCRYVYRLKQASNQRMLKRNKSGARGVILNKHLNKFEARIAFYGDTVSLGYFEDFWEAHQTYLTYYFLKNDEYPPEFRAY